MPGSRDRDGREAPTFPPPTAGGVTPTFSVSEFLVSRVLDFFSVERHGMHVASSFDDVFDTVCWVPIIPTSAALSSTLCG